MSKSLPCPACWHPETDTIDSRPKSSGIGVHRRRKCRRCNQTFTTKETYGDSFPMPNWSRFKHGEPAQLVRKRRDDPDFPSLVIGWYQGIEGARGLVLQHDPDRILHTRAETAVKRRKIAKHPSKESA